jgi:ankyrin repeat protein
MIKILMRVVIISLIISGVGYETTRYAQKATGQNKKMKAKDPFLVFSEGDVKAVTNLLDKGFGVNQPHPESGKTPLFYACENKNPAVVALLLERGAGVNAADKWGETPLRYVIARELVQQDQPTALKIIKLLIKGGANVNVRTNVGFTGLMMAINQKDVEMVEVLLEAGVDIQAELDGATALHYAAETGLISVASKLLQKGVLLNKPDFSRETPLFYAARAGQTELVKFLISQGANVEAADTIGRTPLMAAISKEHCETVQALIAAGASVRVRTKDQNAPLLAGGAANNCITKALIAAGAAINIQDDYGSTPLILAANVGNLTGVKLLIEAGADVSVKDYDGRDAVFYAKQGKYWAIVKVLQQARKKAAPE